MPIRPRKTRSCSMPSSKPRCSSASFGSERKATPSVRSASPASSSLACRICGAALRRQRPCFLAHQLVRTARQQDVRRAFGEDEQTLLPLGVAMNRAHQLAFGRERHLRRCGRSAPRALHPPARPCALRRSARLRSDRPAPSSVRRAPAARRCWRDRRRQAHARSSDRSAPSIGLPPSAPHLALGRVARAAQGHAPARGDDPAHRHLVLGERAGLVGGDDVRRAERLDRREMADDGVPLRHALHAEGRARPSPPPAGLPAPPRPRAPRPG